MSVTLAQTDAEIRECWPVLAQLRPHLKEEQFVATVRRLFDEGYRLAFLRREGTVRAVAGFRILHSLASGRFCFVDDLVTDAGARSQGLGAELFRWLQAQARAAGCRRLELDSGVQRFAAHRFYFEQRLTISCYHFVQELEAAEA